MYDEFKTQEVTIEEPEEGTPETNDELNIMDVPVKIVTEDGAFLVHKIGGWRYQELGVFAIGCWQFADAVSVEQTVLIPYRRVRYLVFDFDALDRYEAAQGADAEIEPPEIEEVT